MTSDGRGPFSGQDPEAFRSRLLAFAKKRIPRACWRKFHPEDAVQLAYIAGWEKRDQFSGKTAARLYSWHRAILENLIKNEIQKLKIKAAEPAGVTAGLLDLILESSDSLLHQFRGSAAPADDSTRRNDLTEAVLQAITRLPERQKEAVELFYQEDLSYEAVAARMNTTVNAVGQLLKRAREQLAVWLRKDSRLETRRANP